MKMTPARYSQFFGLLDEYARKKHKCFVSELFLKSSGAHYAACFRSTSSDRNSADRFACQYVEIEWSNIEAALELEKLPDLVKRVVDERLRLIR